MTSDLKAGDVFAACEQVMAANRVSRDQVNGNMVWKQLGHGSKTTVQRYTKEWREMSGNNRSAAPSLAATINTVEQSISDLVAHAVEQEAERSRIREEASTQQISSLASALANAQHKIEIMMEESVNTDAAIEVLKSDLADANDARMKLAAQVAMLNDQLMSLITGKIPSDLRDRIGGAYLNDLLRPRKARSASLDNQSS